MTKSIVSQLEENMTAAQLFEMVNHKTGIPSNILRITAGQQEIYPT